MPEPPAESGTAGLSRKKQEFGGGVGVGGPVLLYLTWCKALTNSSDTLGNHSSQGTGKETAKKFPSEEAEENY